MANDKTPINCAVCGIPCETLPYSDDEYYICDDCIDECFENDLIESICQSTCCMCGVPIDPIEDMCCDCLRTQQ